MRRPPTRSPRCASSGPWGSASPNAWRGCIRAELHTRQAVWYAAQARGLQAWFARSGNPEVVDPHWPLRPELPAAA